MLNVIVSNSMIYRARIKGLATYHDSLEALCLKSTSLHPPINASDADTIGKNVCLKAEHGLEVGVKGVNDTIMNVLPAGPKPERTMISLAS